MGFDVENHRLRDERERVVSNFSPPSFIKVDTMSVKSKRADSQSI